MKLKIGQMVLVDTVLGTVRPARIEAANVSARVARVLYIDTGERQEDVRFGDISLPGEDATAARREQARDSWRNAGNLQVTNQMGGSYTKAASGSSGEAGHETYGS